jgi:anaerobic magnesium-protoporphyrin IX monomethyl ester cyclase
LKILLIKPPNIETPHVSPLLGFGYISSTLKRHGHEVSILNCIKKAIKFEQIKNFIKDENPQLLGVQVLTCDFSSAKQILQLSKALFSNIPTVVGGSHITGDYKEVLNDFPEADFGIRGEAEFGIIDLIKYIESPGSIKLEDINNLIYRNNGDICFNEQRIVEDIDKLGCPDWDSIDPREYPKPQGTFTKFINTAPMITSRGCPYGCTYCAASLNMGTEFRMRSAKSVVDEIELLINKYCVEEIHIWDDNFSLDRQRAIDICLMIQDRKLDFCWAIPNGIRLDSLDAELLKIMEQAGCYSFSVGIESGSTRIMKLMSKQLELKTIEEKTNLIKKETNIRLTGLFIMGYPTETFDDLKKTLNLSLKLPLDRAQFSDFTPHPGTQVFNVLIESGELLRSKINWDSFQLYLNAYHPKTMTNKQLRSFIAKSFLRFYFRLHILWGVLREINNLTQLRFVLKRWIDIFH